jgi:glc operon protein GlcG
MMRHIVRNGLAAAALACVATPGWTQNAPAAAAAPAAPAAQAAPPTTPYGMPIGLDSARKVAAAVAAEARKIGAYMAIAVVDTAGNLVYFEKMDRAQTGSVPVAIDKARSSALFRRPTKAFQDAVAQGGVGLRFLGIQGAVPVEGGIPLIEAGKLIGAVGVSGGSSEQDAQCAGAGAATVK